jgi:hypothetical protein
MMDALTSMVVWIEHPLGHSSTLDLQSANPIHLNE